MTLRSADPTRRAVVLGLASTAVIAASRSFAADSESGTAAAQLEKLERDSGGRLGVCALDTGSGRTVGWRAEERFGMCSTFKLALAAIVLREADAGQLSLSTAVKFGKADMVPNAPVAARHLEQGSMQIGAMAEATQTTSDNVAANLLVRQLGGPAAVTAKLREMGDPVTRLDRLEPELNFVPPGEHRDTTSPSAFAGLVGRIVGGSLLQPASLAQLRQWMIATQTGVRRLRAGLPASWTAGDKTGTALTKGMANKTNDVAVIWPVDRKPIVIAAYLEADAYYDSIRAADEAVLAAVGRIVAEWAGGAG